MAKKTQDKTTQQTPEEIAQAFLHLWQEKWNDTLQKKGWPKDMPPPQLGQMPFFNPFMPMGAQSPFMSDSGDRIAKLEARVTALEKRLKSSAPKTTKKPVKKPVKKAKRG